MKDIINIILASIFKQLDIGKNTCSKGYYSKTIHKYICRDCVKGMGYTSIATFADIQFCPICDDLFKFKIPNSYNSWIFTYNTYCSLLQSRRFSNREIEYIKYILATSLSQKIYIYFKFNACGTDDYQNMIECIKILAKEVNLEFPIELIL